MRAQMADYPAWRSAGVNESLAATRPEPRRAPRRGGHRVASSGVHAAHDLSDRFGYTWLAAWSRVQLGTLDVAGGQLAEARALLDEALDLSLAIHINRNMVLCLVAFARLAFAEGDPEQAALLAGAAAGLRQRARRRAWPVLRRGEADRRSGHRGPCPPPAGSDQRIGSQLSVTYAGSRSWSRHRYDARPVLPPGEREAAGPALHSRQLRPGYHQGEAVRARVQDQFLPATVKPDEQGQVPGRGTGLRPAQRQRRT